MTRWTEEQLATVLGARTQAALESKPRKYRNQPVEVDGHKFDSKREARRYKELKLLEMGQRIRDLQVHPSFELAVNGEHICKYKADFAYADMRGKLIVEDAKCAATKTQAYRLRKRLMQVLHGITVVEV